MAKRRGSVSHDELMNTDWQAKINSSTNASDKAYYESMRNDKIDAMNSSGTNKGGWQQTHNYTPSRPSHGGSSSGGSIYQPEVPRKPNPVTPTPVVQQPNYNLSPTPSQFQNTPNMPTWKPPFSDMSAQDEMKMNSMLWHTSDAETRKQLEDRNKILGAQLGLGSGPDKDGYWHTADGSVAYQPTKPNRTPWLPAGSVPVGNEGITSWGPNSLYNEDTDPRLDPSNAYITPEEANRGYGWFDQGLGSQDKIQVVNGKVVGGAGNGEFIYNGLVYDVVNGQVLENTARPAHKPDRENGRGSGSLNGSYAGGSAFEGIGPGQIHAWLPDAGKDHPSYIEGQTGDPQLPGLPGMGSSSGSSSSSGFGGGRQPTSAEQMIRDLFAQKIAAEEARLKAMYEQNVSKITGNTANLENIYGAQKNQLAAQNDLTRMQMAELGTAQGLNTGATGQMALGQAGAYLGAMGGLAGKQAQDQAAIERQLADLLTAYNQQLAAAKANNEAMLNESLYNEFVRQDELARQEERDRIAQEKWQAQFDAEQKQWADEMAFKQSQLNAKGGSGGSGSGSGSGGSGYGGEDYGTPVQQFTNGGLTNDQIKQLQAAGGVTVDGIWGQNSSDAWDGISPAEAWAIMAAKSKTYAGDIEYQLRTGNNKVAQNLMNQYWDKMTWADQSRVKAMEPQYGW